MKELADGVWHLKCLPGLPWAVNAYLAGDVLIDAGCRQSTGRIIRQLEGHEVKAHALTHAHPDHQGASRFASANPTSSWRCSSGGSFTAQGTRSIEP